jgi:hypothetical protein
MPRERRVLARLVGRYVGTTRGVFELADGTHVEVDGALDLDSPNAPKPGQKALVVLDEIGRALRWEPYAGADPRRQRD